MKFNETNRIGLAVGIGLLIVMPILYFTDSRPIASKVTAVEDAAKHVAAAANDRIEAGDARILPEPVQYLEVLDGCAEDFGGACVNVRPKPSTDYPAVATLRTGVVLRVAEVIHTQDRDWYRVTFDEWVRYPDRVAKEWYVAGDVVHLFEHAPPEVLAAGETPVTSKRIEVDRTLQMLYAYDGDTLFMEQEISTGNDDTPTPRGTFKIFHKTPSRYMQGPVPGITSDDDVYDLPGVPWTMYFTKQGGAIHGAYWHDEFGQQHSHGCVNLPPEKAKELYEWAELGTPVYIHD